MPWRSGMPSARVVGDVPAKLAAALIGALLTVLGGVYTFGRDLGEAQAKAEYWRAYSEGVARMPAECRRG